MGRSVRGRWRGDAIGLLVVAACLGGLLLYRASVVEPRAWGALCAAAAPPLSCAPRQALLWLQYQYLWGIGALLCGLAAFVGGARPVAVAAVALGAAAVVNDNASWGMVGLALGAWAWITQPPPNARAGAG
jgi:hypothetical protein